MSWFSPVIYAPFYLCAIYAFIFEKNWIRVPGNSLNVYRPVLCGEIIDPNCSSDVGLWPPPDHGGGSEGGAIRAIRHTQSCHVPGSVWNLHRRASRGHAPSCQMPGVRKTETLIILFHRNPSIYFYRPFLF